MAVSVQSSFHPSLDMWNLGDHPAPYSSTESDGVPASMTYQYPAGSGLELPSNILPGYHHPSLNHIQSQSPLLSKGESPTFKNKTASGINKSAKIRKSMSTPNVRGQASAEAAALALSAEKKRNKLGYHRTSVACGHCRRRKIRCVPAIADPQNRCSNCIRLKKECEFHPVDQQPPLPESKRRGSRAQSVRQSESSSPSTSTSQIPEMPSIVPHMHLNMPPIQDLGGPRMKGQQTPSFSPEHKSSAIAIKPESGSYPRPTVVTSSRNYEYPQPPQGHVNWMAPEPSPGSKTPGDMPQTYWRPNPQDSPITPVFSPFTPGLGNPPLQNWPASHAEPSPREELGWSGPQRSVSYSNIEGLQNQQHYSAYPHPPTSTIPEQYDTKPRILPSSSSNMYPPPISTSHHPSPGPASAPIHGTLDQHAHSANALPPVPFSSWQHQNQQPSYPYQKPMSAPSEQYGWHPSHHDVHPPPPPPPPANYGYGDPAGVYYTPHQGR